MPGLLRVAQLSIWCSGMGSDGLNSLSCFFDVQSWNFDQYRIDNDPEDDLDWYREQGPSYKNNVGCTCPKTQGLVLVTSPPKKIQFQFLRYRGTITLGSQPTPWVELAATSNFLGNQKHRISKELFQHCLALDVGKDTNAPCNQGPFSRYAFINFQKQNGWDWKREQKKTFSLFPRLTYLFTSP